MSSVGAVSAVSTSVSKSVPSSGSAQAFGTVLDRQRGQVSELFQLPQGMIEMARRVMAGGAVSLPQMMVFQTQMHQLNVRVELAAKAADGLLSSARKLQQQQ